MHTRHNILLAFVLLISALFLSACVYNRQSPASSVPVPPSVGQESLVPTVTPTPTITPTPTPSPSPTPTPTPSPSPTPIPMYIEPQTDEPVWYDGFVDPRTVRAEVVPNPEDITVLVNKYYAMPEDYVPELVAANHSAGQQLRKEASDAWDLMHTACLEECEQNLYLVSGYRSYDTQAYSFSNGIERNGLAFAVQKNAYQGRSEHPLGLALDINIASDPEIRDGFAETTAGQWVAEHGHEYGFILRYPREKGSITGYGYEAWHYRYVGVDLATELYETEQTLEEYYGKEQILPATNE